MSTSWDAHQRATHPFERRRDVFQKEQAAHTAAAQAATPEAPRANAPFIHDPLKTCVCGARPRYGFDEHVKHCAKAQEAARAAALTEAIEREIAEPPPVTAADVVQAIEATTEEKPASADNATCPNCGKGFKTKHVPHFHKKNCKG